MGVLSFREPQPHHRWGNRGTDKLLAGQQSQEQSRYGRTEILIVIFALLIISRVSVGVIDNYSTNKYCL